MEEKRRSGKATDDEVEDAIRQAHGNASFAARILTQSGHRYTRSGILKRIQRSERLSQAHADAKAEICDLAEWKILKKVNDGDLRACIFILEHLDPRYKPTLAVEESEARPRRTSKELEELMAKRGWRRDSAPKTNEEPKENGDAGHEGLASSEHANA